MTNADWTAYAATNARIEAYRRLMDAAWGGSSAATLARLDAAYEAAKAAEDASKEQTNA